MQKQTLTLANYNVERDCTVANYNCNFTVTTAGDGYWDCEAGRVVTVTSISVVTCAYEDNINVTVNVTHDSTWDIYTDTAFSDAISAALGFAVGFTEQGMQEDNFASMEA